MLRPNEDLREGFEGKDASISDLGERVYHHGVECVVKRDRTLTCAIELDDELEVQWMEDGEHELRYINLYGTDAAMIADNIDELGVAGRGVDGADIEYKPGSPSHPSLPDTGIVIEVNGTDRCNLGENGVSCWEG